MIIEGKKAIWKDYQKAIADDNYYYVRSCVRQNFFPGAETTFLRIMREGLGKDVYEHPCHTSCSGIAYHSDLLPPETAMTVIARQFAIMTESGYKNLNFGLSAGGRANLFGSHSLIFEYDQLLTKQDLDEQPKPNLSLGWEIGTATHSFQVFAASYSNIIKQYNLL